MVVERLLELVNLAIDHRYLIHLTFIVDPADAEEPDIKWGDLRVLEPGPLKEVASTQSSGAHIAGSILDEPY
jgi:hypothetical protein